MLTRRQFLNLAAQASADFVLLSSIGFARRVIALDQRHVAGTPSLEERIAQVIKEYDSQGNHRTGTETDVRSARWLAHRLERLGLRASLEPFRLRRVNPRLCFLRSGERRIDGLPLFDASFTGADGLVGRLGHAGENTDFGLIVADETAVKAEGQPFVDLRRSGRHKAFVIAAQMLRAGLSPINARHFAQQFGPPVLQVSSDEIEWLNALAAQRQEIRLVVHATRTFEEAYNVVARIRGNDPRLLPLVVMTPRSGWWTCAAERASGIACWLETARALRQRRLARSVVFVATSGHELGHMGLEAFLARRPELQKGAFAWLHFGAGIGAAQSTGSLLQSSDDELEELAVVAMTRAGTKVDRMRPRDSMPTGEVRNVRERGGRYLSLQQTTAYFHNAADRWPASVDIAAVARYATAFADLAAVLAKADMN